MKNRSDHLRAGKKIDRAVWKKKKQKESLQQSFLIPMYL